MALGKWVPTKQNYNPNVYLGASLSVSAIIWILVTDSLGPEAVSKVLPIGDSRPETKRGANRSNARVRMEQGRHDTPSFGIFLRGMPSLEAYYIYEYYVLILA